ncbi:MAG: hypothetical protein RLZZ383_880 [Pseudomonadota bacterium]|jgi:hypothetical protein
MTTVLALCAAVVALGGFALVRWHHGRVVMYDTCPVCQAPPLVLSAAGKDHAYDALACPVCTWAGASLQDAAFRRCWCASCGEVALQVTVSRLPADPPRIHVHERCVRCEAERTFEASVEPSRKLGRVVAFKQKPRREGDATTEESQADVIPLFPVTSTPTTRPTPRTTNRS